MAEKMFLFTLLILSTASNALPSGTHAHLCVGVPEKYLCSSQVSIELCEVQDKCRALAGMKNQSDISRLPKKSMTAELLPKHVLSESGSSDFRKRRIEKKSGREHTSTIIGEMTYVPRINLPAPAVSNNQQSVPIPAEEKTYRINLAHAPEATAHAHTTGIGGPSGNTLMKFRKLLIELNGLRVQEAEILERIDVWESKFLVRTNSNSGTSMDGGQHGQPIVPALEYDKINIDLNITIPISEQCLTTMTAHYYGIYDYCEKHFWPQRPMSESTFGNVHEGSPADRKPLEPQYGTVREIGESDRSTLLQQLRQYALYGLNSTAAKVTEPEKQTMDNY